MKGKTIVVTGANRGIGYEIARQLLARGSQVILTARKSEAAQAAAEGLEKDGLKPTAQVLDVTRHESVEALSQFIQAKFGKLDVLINNAGILLDQDTEVMQVDLGTVRTTLETNTLAPLHLAQRLTPLLRASASGRIINVSSGMGALTGMGSDHAAYRLSKAALNALTLMLAATLQADGIAVNAACPGWVRTDMGGPNAERPVAQGADTPVWLALDAPQNLTGKFVRDRRVIEW